MIARLVDAAVWSAVMDTAGWRCECTGECGNAHTASRHRCPVEHWPTRPLLIAPTDPAAGVVRAATAFGDDLAAWCTCCHRQAVSVAGRRAGQAAAGAQPDLFGGDAS